MIDADLLSVLCCPETKQALHVAPAAAVAQLNARIASGTLLNRGGKPIRDRIDGGLIRQDGLYLYPIRQEIPVMLVEEGISTVGTTMS